MVMSVSALYLLDLTVAFDTVDHDLLMLRLERQFGIRGVVLQWFRSYLTGRTFQVIYADSQSSLVIICCSVSQLQSWVPVCLSHILRTLKTQLQHMM